MLKNDITKCGNMPKIYHNDYVALQAWSDSHFTQKAFYNFLLIFKALFWGNNLIYTKILEKQIITNPLFYNNDCTLQTL